MRTGSNSGTDPAAAWFRRRPCFWWAVSLILGFCILPSWLPWTLLLLAGALGAVALSTAGRFPIGSCLLLFAVGGCLSSHLDAPHPDARLGAGRPVTVRGVVERVLSGSSEHRRLVIRGEVRLTPQGWQAERIRLGMDGPPDTRVGERVQVSGLLQRPLPATNPGGFDSRRYWLAQGVALLLEPHERGYLRLAPPPAGGLTAVGARLRHWVQATNRRTLDPRTAAIADSFLIGADDGTDPEIIEDLDRTFRSAGTIHLLVVSGTQVGAVLALFVLCGKRLWRFRLLWWTLGLAVLLVYHAATGGDASITRAAVFGGMIVLALTLMREVDGENTLGLTLLLLVAVHPTVLFDVGAQLSFAAVWGLIRLTPTLARQVGSSVEDATSPPPAGVKEPPWWWRAVKLAFCANVAAHLATAPILAYHFQTSCWAALLSNLCVLPLAACLLPICIGHLVLSQCGLVFMAPVVTALAHGLYSWSSLFGPPLGAVRVFPPPAWLILVFFGLIGFTARFSNRFRWPAAGALVAVLLVSERVPLPPPAVPTVRAIDIGQGDAILLQGPDGSNILVDAGPPPLRPDRSALGQALRGLRVDRLDAVVVTHAHADHIGGLPQLLQEFKIGTLLYGPRIQPTLEWREVLTAAAGRKVKGLEVSAGDRLSVGGSQLVVLAPDTRSGMPNEDPNEESLVVRWEVGGKRVLLTGDAGFPTEAALLKSSASRPADVLKVGHHGSSRSTSRELLASIRPYHALISCGRRNRFGHPHRATLERLESAGVPVSRTDEGGMVTLRLERSAVVSQTYLRSGARP